MAGRLKDKIAVITGACSGIGLGTLELFVEEGAVVLAADIQDEYGKQLEARFKDKVRYAHCDVTKPDEIKAAIDLAASHFGGLDILYNNAGAAGAPGGLEDFTLEEWDQTFALLMRSVVAGTQFAIPHMKARGGGAIVNTSSISALASGYAPVAYSTAKAGVLHFTKVAAANLAIHKIRVNAVIPGFIATSIFGSALGMTREGAVQFAAQMAERAAKIQPAGRAGQPRDIGEAVVYLSSDAAQFVTGTSILVDGGLTIGTRASWDPEASGPMMDILGLTPEQMQAMNATMAAARKAG
ncbi:MAG: SDR family NAD(P)-dependent oxidoreductase [Hyphomonadaceae bacterium]